MTHSLLVSYLARPTHSLASGLRVWAEGKVELSNGDDWKPVAQLGPSQLQRLATFVRDSGIFDLATEVPAPPGMRDGATCEWEAELDGRRAEVTVRGWSDENPAARPLRNLVMQLYDLIAAAQRGEVS